MAFLEIWRAGELWIRDELIKFWKWLRTYSGYFVIFIDGQLV